MKKKVIIVGAGGHCKVILDILLANQEYEIAGLIDQNQEKKQLGISVIGDDNALHDIFRRGISYAFVAIGNNPLRKKLCLYLREIGYELVNAISPDAVVSSHCKIGQGVAVMPGAVVNVETCLGDGCIINTNASVDHECTIGDFAHVAPGAALSGCVTVGELSFLGTGCRVIDRVSIGQGVMLGAGAVAISSIPDFCTAVGVPARIKNKDKGVL